MPFRLPPEQVSAHFSRASYYAHKHRVVGAWDIVHLDSDPVQAGLRVRYSMKANARVPLPATVQKLLGGTLTIVQTDEWNGRTQTGSILITVKGLPIKAESRARLEASPEGTIMVSDWTLTCGIPLVGGIVERLLADDIQSRLKLECAAVGEAPLD